MTKEIIKYSLKTKQRRLKTFVILAFLVLMLYSVFGDARERGSDIIPITNITPNRSEVAPSHSTDEPEKKNEEVQSSKVDQLNEHEKRIYTECSKMDMSKEEISFVLANVNHETGQFKFLEEINGKSQARRLNYGGGENWYGRGYIMLTHKSNYEKWSGWTGQDLISNPSLLITDLDLSARIACSGIKHGSFTGIKGGISVFNGDWYKARALVNGDRDYRAGCANGHCWTIGTKIKDLTEKYINLIK